MAPEVFDYVIVGAGAAGCVLANRLTEDKGTRVLLLEAGGATTGCFKDMPIAFPRSSSTISADNIVRLPGIISAPPAPCTILKMISIRVETEHPQPADPIRNTTIPVIYMRFRPNLSPSTPPIRISAASISR